MSPLALPDNNRLALRRVARAQRKTALSTLQDGAPYVSLATVAFDHDLSPILLLSGLSDHTRNLRADPRAALLLDGTEGHPNPQTGPRVTLTGVMEEDATPRPRARFLARHPGAALYAGFADFSIWRMRLERAHFVGGFGRAVWFDAPLLSLSLPEDELLARLNRDGVGAALALRLEAGPGDWSLAAIDPDGCEIMAGESWRRADFPTPADTPEAALAAVLALTETGLEKS